MAWDEYTAYIDDGALAEFDLRELSVRDQYQEYGAGRFAAESSLIGTGNTPPLISDTPQKSGQQNDPMENVAELIKKGVGLAKQITQGAREVGQAVGAIQKSVESVGPQFEAGRTDGARVTKLQTWLDNTATTDKIVIGLGVIGLYLTLAK